MARDDFTFRNKKVDEDLWVEDDSASDSAPRMEGLSLKDKDDVLVVGIDFGTT